MGVGIVLHVVRHGFPEYFHFAAYRVGDAYLYGRFSHPHLAWLQVRAASAGQ